MTRIILVRHGQTEWNRVERFRGRADVPLNETGLRQAELTAGRVAAAWKPTAVYASPLARAMRTAEAIASRLALDVHSCPDLIDVDFGHWHGLTPGQVRQRWPEELSAWYGAPERVRIPGGESLQDVRERCGHALRELPALHGGATIVWVSHMDINRLILLIALGLENDRLRRVRQDNCAINELEMIDDELVVVSMNDTSHLARGQEALS